MRPSCSSLRVFLMVALVLPIAAVAIARPGMTAQPFAIAFGTLEIALKMG